MINPHYKTKVPSWEGI